MDDEVDRLYSKPLAEFTAARDALARALRRNGDTEAAQEVKALRKPTVSAWAINQLARKERMKVRSLLVAGETLRAAHADLLGGGQPEKVRKAADAERNAIKHLVASAATILSEEGHTPSENMLDRIATTLRAAAVDDEARTLLERGRLTADLDPSGFGPLALVPAAPAPKRGKRGAASDATARRRTAAEERVGALRAEVKELAEVLSAAEARLVAAERDLRAAERDARGARAKYERAERRLESAQAELQKLRKR
jgi:hypothetical protein